MDKIPKEWVDKLFNCMEEFYGERWRCYFDKPHFESLYKTMWQNGLVGLTYEEIKHALILCKRSALHSVTNPPNLIEFFRFAKGYEIPKMEGKAKLKIQHESIIRQKAMSEIRKKLGIRSNIEIYSKLVK